jgi:hypothetical protein
VALSTIKPTNNFDGKLTCAITKLNKYKNNKKKDIQIQSNLLWDFQMEHLNRFTKDRWSLITGLINMYGTVKGN